MRGTGKQDASGNALEYAVAARIVDIADAELQNSTIAQTSRRDYESVSADVRGQLDNAADKSVAHLFLLESLARKGVREVRMQPDAVGQKGDPRDLVLMLKLENSDIGISIKLNNAVAKNSRLQRTAPTFCDKWNLGCTHSDLYQQRIASVFDAVDSEKEKGVCNWNEINDKDEKVYAPIINAFADEFASLARGSNCLRKLRSLYDWRTRSLQGDGVLKTQTGGGCRAGI